jgi:hypothetical protein
MIAHALANCFVRPLAEKAFNGDKGTPGRIASILQGLTCTILIFNKQWKEAIGTTLIFFIMDLIFDELYKLPRIIEMKLHHIFGILCCSASLYYKTYDPKEIACNLTRALIILEVCNPLLHVLVTLKKENQLHRFSSKCQNVWKIILALQFFLIRVLLLGAAFIQFVYFYDWSRYQSFLIFIAGALWVLQLYWFKKLLKFNP